MFTGIVEGVGRIVAVEPQGDGCRLRVDAGPVAVDDVAIGDSIAVSGCCLTVVSREGSLLAFDVSAETLRCTTGLASSRHVNLEKALRFGDRVGGHLVTGHVDGVGEVVTFQPAPSAMQGSDARSSATAALSGGGEGSFLLVVRAPAGLARFVAAKGSIAVDGVSLTVNQVDDASFAVNLIPHTLAVTTLGALHPGSTVNLEVDILARYVARLADAGRA